MDYYEEFGVPRTATPDQIRQAHKGLARLLHPDHFQDPRLRQLAESQMKRINEIFAALSDPVRRRQYDQPPAPLPPRARYREHAGWCVAVVVALAWIATSPVKSPVPVTQSVPAPLPQPAAENHPTPRPMARPARRTPPRDSSVHPSATVATVYVPSPPAIEAPPPVAVAAAVETPAPVSAPSLPSPPPPKPKGLSGRWLYLHPALAPASKELYPPEYIEAAIVEESGGTLRGRYRARYRVTNRAISPEVEFQFEGADSGNPVSLRWSGGGGSRGEVLLNLVSPNSLEVIWFATELGKYLGLGSGTAVLIRRQEP